MKSENRAFPQRQYLKHEVPHWVREDAQHSAFFITISCKQRGQNQLAKNDVWKVIIESAEHRNEQQTWFCSLLLAMPDHIHGIFRFEEDSRMKDAMRNWKKWTSNQCQISWQRGFFDHRLRTNESGVQKREYILNNPIRANLVTDIRDWPYVISTR